jgi:O-antigen/teichoic acid export membrane protein
MFSAVFINIILNIFLIPGYGLIGATCSTLLACLFSTALTIFFSYKFIFIKVSFISFLYYLLCAVLMMLAVNKVHVGSLLWVNLILKIFFGILIYTLVVIIKEKELRIIIRKFVSNPI